MRGFGFGNFNTKFRINCNEDNKQISVGNQSNFRLGLINRCGRGVVGHHKLYKSIFISVSIDKNKVRDIKIKND